MSSEALYVDKAGYQQVINQVHQMRDLLSPLTSKIAQKQGTGMEALCDQSIAAAVAAFQSAWVSENALNVKVLDEIARKMSETLDRYEATDGRGAQEINVTVQQAGSS